MVLENIMKLGSDINGEFTFIDAIALVSFGVALQNLDENLTQNDKQELQNQLSEQLNTVLNEIHAHLEQQDDKIDKILQKLEVE